VWQIPPNQRLWADILMRSGGLGAKAVWVWYKNSLCSVGYAAMTDEAERRNVWMYVWLCISALINISGMASIVDGFVHWADFFSHLIDIYRAIIREPLAYVVHLVWPSWWPKIPPRMFDYLVVCSAVFLSFNMSAYEERGKTILGLLKDVEPEEGLRVLATVIVITAFIFGPFLMFLFTAAYIEDILVEGETASG
jgi:hypothetical protein